MKAITAKVRQHPGRNILLLDVKGMEDNAKLAYNKAREAAHQTLKKITPVTIPPNWKLMGGCLARLIQFSVYKNIHRQKEETYKGRQCTQEVLNKIIAKAKALLHLRLTPDNIWKTIHHKNLHQTMMYFL